MTTSHEDSAGLDPARVETMDEIWRLDANTQSVFVSHLTNEKLAAVAATVPRLRYLTTDGNNRVTDSGLASLATFTGLESLDLEWSEVTDGGLGVIASVGTLRWLDIGFCPAVTESGVAWLRQQRPDVEVVSAQV
jgi:hypothetical protein